MSNLFHLVLLDSGHVITLYLLVLGVYTIIFIIFDNFNEIKCNIVLIIFDLLNRDGSSWIEPVLS